MSAISETVAFTRLIITEVVPVTPQEIRVRCTAVAGSSTTIKPSSAVTGPTSVTVTVRVSIEAGRFATGTRPLPFSVRQLPALVPAVHWAALTMRESLPCATVFAVVP